MMLLNPLTLRRCLGLALFAAILWGLWEVDKNGYNRATLQYQAQIVKDKAAMDKAAQAAKDAAQIKLDAQAQTLRVQETGLIMAGEKIDALTKILKGRSHAESTQYRATPTANLASLPDWIVTNGWLCDYNRAIDGSGALPEAATTTPGTDDPACQADPFSPSGTSAESILNHHIEYAAYTAKLDAQLTAVLNYFEFLKGQ